MANLPHKIAPLATMLWQLDDEFVALHFATIVDEFPSQQKSATAG
jgi:hypothetical protein